MNQTSNTDYLKVLLLVLPAVWAGMTIFFTYNEISVFLLTGLMLVLFELYGWQKIGKSYKSLKAKVDQVLPYGLVLVGAIGTSASINLVREKIAALTDPSHVASCSINPIVACSPVINSSQAEAFGIPNPLLGVFGFAAVFIAGMSILAGGKFNKIWWLSLWFGSLLSLIFSAWLIYVTLYEIGALCIYCMVTWLVVIPNFYYLSIRNIHHRILPMPPKLRKVITENHMFFPLATYLLVITLIYFRFSDYWNSLI